eukprot:6179988-Pleurochrysis_carterae.AAC.1
MNNICKRGSDCEIPVLYTVDTKESAMNMSKSANDLGLAIRYCRTQLFWSWRARGSSLDRVGYA